MFAGRQADSGARPRVDRRSEVADLRRLGAEEWRARAGGRPPDPPRDRSPGGAVLGYPSRRDRRVRPHALTRGAVRRHLYTLWAAGSLGERAAEAQLPGGRARQRVQSSVSAIRRDAIRDQGASDARRGARVTREPGWSKSPATGLIAGLDAQSVGDGGIDAPAGLEASRPHR